MLLMLNVLANSSLERGVAQKAKISLSNDSFSKSLFALNNIVLNIPLPLLKTGGRSPASFISFLIVGIPEYRFSELTSISKADDK